MSVGGTICLQMVYMCKFDFWSSDFLSSLNFGQVTDRHTYIQKVTHKSPPCIRTGGLKNRPEILYKQAKVALDSYDRSLKNLQCLEIILVMALLERIMGSY